jgi:hypothetical protein
VAVPARPQQPARRRRARAAAALHACPVCMHAPQCLVRACTMGPVRSCPCSTYCTTTALLRPACGNKAAEGHCLF